MENEYSGVTTRFLRNDERFILSDEKEMPFVIEAKDKTDIHFLQTFLRTYSKNILADIKKYGAVLLRGFDIASDQDFETTVLSIQGMRGISEAFMSENGRVPVDNLKYVLHTNAIYKTGGTLYLGGFHSENYYTPDMPSYISFCCLKPSLQGGETGIVHTGKVYQALDRELKNKLENKAFFVDRWLLSEVVKRYQMPAETIEAICKQFGLTVMDAGKDKYIVMYKPSVFKDKETKKRALQINLFQLPTLNKVMRKYFKNDYQGKEWRWHRFVWCLPKPIFFLLEHIYMVIASLIYSPKNTYKILISKTKNFIASKKYPLPKEQAKTVNSCFGKKDIQQLAALLRQYYSSCLWQKGDILLVDNKQVMHTGMPGAGPRLIRAMICNPLEMSYQQNAGLLESKERLSETIGYYVSIGKFERELKPEEVNA